LTFVPMQAHIIDSMGTDLSIVNAARMSYGKKSSYQPDGTLSPRDQGLLLQLATGLTRTEREEFLEYAVSSIDYPAISRQHQHNQMLKVLDEYRSIEPHDTPFNHAALSATMMCPISIARQLVKHEYMIWSEISRRYLDGDWKFWLPTLGDGSMWRGEGVKHRAGPELPPPLQRELTERMKDSTASDFYTFRRAVELGAAFEQARNFLPLNTMVEVTWTGTLGAFAKMMRQRMGPTAQTESRIIAQMLYDQALPLFPHSLPLLLKGVL
jgi:thymidylate synthase (FAD)